MDQSLNRRERRKLKTRNELKGATAEMLLEHGFEGLTIQQITDRADLARATFYLHFGDVEEAVWAVMADEFSELMRVMWEVEGESSEERRFHKWVRVFEFVDHHRPLIQVVLGERGHIKLMRKMLEFMTRSLEEDLRSRKVDRTTDLPIEFEAQFYSGAVLNTIQWWIQADEPYSPVEMAEMVQEIVVRGRV